MCMFVLEKWMKCGQNWRNTNMGVNNVKRRGTNNWSTLSLVELFGLSGFRKGFTTLDHILTLQGIIEECRALNERIYVCFVNFLKAFNNVPDQLMQQCTFRYVMGNLSSVWIYARKISELRFSNCQLEKNKDAHYHPVMLLNRTRIVLARWKGGILTLHTYLWVTFIGSRLFVWEAACAWLSHGYSALGALENVAHLQFQEPETSLLWLDTILISTVFCWQETWLLNFNWRLLRADQGTAWPHMHRGRHRWR